MRARGWGCVLWWGAALFSTVACAAMVLAVSALFSVAYAASYTVPGFTPCAGYTVVKRSYPPSTVPTAIVVKCPAGAGWRDQLVVKGVIPRLTCAFALKPQDVVITCK